MSWRGSYLNDVDDPTTRRVLEASSVVRRVTAPLLSAMLRNVEPDDAFGRLLKLPFVDPSRDGLVVHESVTYAIADYLRAAHPTRYLDYRLRRLARASYRGAHGSTRRPLAVHRRHAVPDRQPVVREAFFPSGAQPLAVEPSRPADESAVLAIVRRHEREAAAAILERWWECAQQAFSVVRDRDGEVTGFSCCLTTRWSAVLRCSATASLTPGRRTCASIRCRRVRSPWDCVAGSTSSSVSSPAQRRRPAGST